ADVLAPVERRLEDRFADGIQSLQLSRDKALRTERLKVIEHELTDGAGFDDLVRRTRDQIKVARLKFEPHFSAARSRVAYRRHDLNNFKTENLLDREASYHSPLLAGGVLAFAFVSETLANAWLFADVSSYGFAGG